MDRGNIPTGKCLPVDLANFLMLYGYRHLEQMSRYKAQLDLTSTLPYYYKSWKIQI